MIWGIRGRMLLLTSILLAASSKRPLFLTEQKTLHMDNLPPGVTENMIPGNRPEDALYEQLFERLPIWIQDEIEKDSDFGKKLDQRFQEFIRQIFTEDDVIREMSYILDEDSL